MVCFWAARDGVRSGPGQRRARMVGTGMVGAGQAGRASTRESPLVHCALCVCGARYVVLVVGNALLHIDVASKFYPKDAEAFDEYLQIDFEAQRLEIRCDT